MNTDNKIERKVRLFNTLTRKVEEFETIEPNQVKMYTCGLTVYSHPQIGNWVAYIYSDVLTRTLKAVGYEVERVQNITDVGHLVSDDDAGEDKMEKGARAEGLTAWDVAEKYIEIADEEAYAKLKLLRPNKLVRATDLIPEQIEFVKGLEEKGYTYVIEDGVYFDTSKLNDYGKLAKLDIEGLDAGARVDVGGKKSKTDFALWKFSPRDQKRDMEWDSSWGKGFPGWHLECSVIARENLGDQIDIHTGGIDHIPVHHTNEIAQTESLTGKKPFVRYWFHNNFMKIDGSKLSKSLNNSYTLEDIETKGYSLDAFKLLVLSSHYRTEGNFTWEILEAAQNRLKRWRGAFDLRWQDYLAKDSAFLGYEACEELLEKLRNDIDTPVALNVVDTAVKTFESGSICAGCMEDFGIVIKDLLGIDLLGPDITSEQA
ncbi:MAG: cysteinyl-tRNA synthetase, partial [Patescibacteria group bacterium]|nr:cysteinyl-tRNA synthetase [Patescibacteria group bacterium]